MKKNAMRSRLQNAHYATPQVGAPLDVRLIDQNL
jgi:hypothetical protein